LKFSKSKKPFVKIKLNFLPYQADLHHNFKTDLKVHFSLEFISLPLRYEWKLSRNSSSQKINGIVTARFNSIEEKGEIAPNIRYQETPDLVQLEFDSVKPILESGFEVQEWNDILNKQPICQALRMGLDMAFQNLVSALEQNLPEERFGLRKAEARSICYTIPVMDKSEIEGFITRENLFRFSWLKIKVHKDSAFEMVNEAMKYYPGQIAIDGNESWLDPKQVLDFTGSLPKDRILFLEQPMPAAQKEDYIQLKGLSPIEIWADESVLGNADPDFWKMAFSGINVKLMKAGSFDNAIHLLKTARLAGLKTMVGCMVETSLGISAALALESLANYMDLDGFLLLENEPFHLVKEKNGVVSNCIDKTNELK